MKVVNPIIITGSILTACNVPEPDPSQGEVAWNAATNYATGAVVVRTTTHMRYERIFPGGVDSATPESDATKWLELGPTNRQSMFDLLRSTQTVGNGDIVLTLTPGQRIDSLLFFGLEATQITVVGTVAGATVYNWTSGALTRRVASWYEYFFTPFRFKDSTQADPIPPNSGMVLTITIHASNGAPKIGGIVMGLGVYLGSVATGASNDGLNFSTIERDATYGTATLVPRRTVPKTIQSVMIPEGRVPIVLQMRKDLNAVPAAWVGVEDSENSYYESMMIFGVYKRFEITHDDQLLSNLQLEIEEL